MLKTTKALLIGFVSSLAAGLFSAGAVVTYLVTVDLHPIDNQLANINKKLSSVGQTVFVMQVLPSVSDVDVRIRENFVYYLAYGENAVLHGPAAGTGIKIEGANDTWLRKFRDAARTCSASAPVSIEVEGFASSAEFRVASAKKKDSDRLNLEAANRRATAVVEYLGFSNNSAVVVRHEPWDSYEEMQEALSFNDRPGLLPVPHAELLNRSVRLIVTDPGGCARTQM